MLSTTGRSTQLTVDGSVVTSREFAQDGPKIEIEDRKSDKTTEPEVEKKDATLG